MKRALSLLLCAAMLTLTACGGQTEPQTDVQDPAPQPEENVVRNWEGSVSIELSDTGVKVDGKTAAEDETAAVYIGAPIVYYEAGKDFTYGEGTESDAHSAEEANAHTVVTITQPGTYVLSGKLSAGQVAVDLGEDAEDDPNAVVTLVLDQVDITCSVAPAVIFYNVYECGDKDNPAMDVDTSAAGANVIIADGTENHINGSYVARIYKPESVVLNEDGTEVEDAKKLHKYDGAFYSKMSMNITGEGGNSGSLNIDAENEGLDSEMHLTINGGNICINSGNDGINTNEDGVSVTTMNGGYLVVSVNGATGEGDGIDSNGWLVINGGTVVASACANSADAGIDSDMGIHIGAGATVVAAGHMLDRMESADQNYAVFQFNGTRSGDSLTLKNAEGTRLAELGIQNDFSVLIYSSPDLIAGDYTLWSGETQLGHSGVRTGGMGGFAGGGGRPGGMMPGGMEPPEGFDPENMPEIPVWNEGMERPEPPEDFAPENMPMMPAEPPEGGFGGRGPGMGGQKATEKIFTIEARENYFSGVGELSE